MAKKKTTAAPAAPADGPVLLGEQPGCRQGACKIGFLPWSGMDHWSCPSCGFTTFRLEDAVSRAPNRAAELNPNDQENHHAR